jgi:hypothetical protein
MGAYSTVILSRADAINRINDELSNIEDCTNAQLGDILFALLSEKVLDNYAVVDVVDARDRV